MSKLSHFVPSHQAISNAIAERLSARFAAMPKTYEQDGMGDKAVAHLRYCTFDGRNNWFITEKDKEQEQHQAFGLVDLAVGYGSELGYISLVELCSIPQVQLDTSFEPMTLAQVKQTYQLD